MKRSRLAPSHDPGSDPITISKAVFHFTCWRIRCTSGKVTSQPNNPASGTATLTSSISESSGTDTSASPKPVSP